MPGNYACLGCPRSFTSERYLASHQRQSGSCRWILDLRNDARPAADRNYIDGSDQEDDPPHAHMDDPQNYEPGVDWEVEEDRSAIDSAMGNLAEPQETPPRPERPEEPLPRTPQNLQHDPLHRAATEKALDDEPASTVEYHGAGRILRHDEDVCELLQASKRDKAALFEPFKNEIDFQFARWAKEECIASNAITRLLEIPEVRSFNPCLTTARPNQLAGGRQAWSLLPQRAAPEPIGGRASGQPSVARIRHINRPREVWDSFAKAAVP